MEEGHLAKVDKPFRLVEVHPDPPEWLCEVLGHPNHVVKTRRPYQDNGCIAPETVRDVELVPSHVVEVPRVPARVSAIVHLYHAREPVEREELVVTKYAS